MGKKALLEAVLFLSGKALTERQLADVTGMDTTTVKRLLSMLVREYEERDGGLEIARRGRRWVLQVREEYLSLAAGMAPSTLPVGVLKTAGLIAYYQPVKQSKLVSILGPKVYDHVRRLREKGLISVRPSGRTVELSTTSKFLDFFGLAARDREELKRLMEERVRQQGSDEATSGVLEPAEA
jgi:segregation and condensation protein B